MNETAEQQYAPFYDGYPVIVRLLSGDDVLCIAYEDPTGRVILERPLRILYETSEDIRDTTGADSVNFAKIHTRFERWMAFSDVNTFPVYSDHVVSIAPLSRHLINSYIGWADQLYRDSLLQPEDASSTTNPGTDTPTKSTEPISSPGPTASDDEKQSYADFILHSFEGKGKPN